MSESEEIPEDREIPLKASQTAFEVPMDRELTKFHGLENSTPVEFRITTDTKYLVFDCEVDPPEPLTSRTRSVARTEDGYTARLRMPQNPLIEAGFEDRIEGGKEVLITVTSTGPGKFRLSFSPPMTPLQVIGNYTDALLEGGDTSLKLKNPINDRQRTVKSLDTPTVQTLQQNKDGERQENIGYRAYISKKIDRAYGGLSGREDTVFAAFNLSIYRGQPALVVGLGTDVDDGQPHVNRIWGHTAVSGEDWNNGDDYTVSYVMFPRDYVAMLGWEDTELMFAPMEDALVVFPAPPEFQDE